MKNRFKIATFLLIAGLCLGSATGVVASGLTKPLVKVSAEQNSFDAKPGDIIEVVINASDIGDFSKGANAYSGKLEYNKAVFEQLTKNSFEELNGWKELEYNPTNDEFISYGSSRITQGDTPLLKISFKVKNAASGGDAEIKIVDFVAAEGDKDFTYEEQREIIESEDSKVNVGVKITGSGNAGSTGNISNAGNTENTGNTDNTDNAENTGNTGNTDTDNTGNAGNAGGNGNTGGNTGNAINAGNTTQNNGGQGTILEEISSSADGFDIVASNTTEINSEMDDVTEESETVEKSDVAGEIIGANSGELGVGTLEESSTENKFPFVIITVAVLSGAVLIATSLGIFAFKRRRKNNHIIRSIIALLLAGTMLFTSADIVSAMYADVNADNIITDKDLKDLEKYLIGLLPIESIRKENADIDTDEELTINDLSMLIEKVEVVLEAEKKDAPEGSLTDVALVNANDRYPAKGGTIRYSFTGADLGVDSELSGRKISGVVVNDKEYPVTESDGKYQISVVAPQTAGKSTIDFQYLVLAPSEENGKETMVKLGNSADMQVSVQRSAPTMSDYEIRVDEATGNATVTFTLNDPDNSLKEDSLKNALQVWRTSPNSSRDGLTDLRLGENTVTFRAINNYSYRIQIRPPYYRIKDEDIIEGNPPAKNQQKTADANYDQNYSYVADYGVTFRNMKAYNSMALDRESESSNFGRNDNIFLGFNSSNEYGVALRNAKINGRSGYNLTRMEDGRYRVALGSGVFAPGSNTITINEVTLENGSVVPVNPSIEIVITSARPEVKAPALVETKDELRVMTEIIDRDDTFISGTVTVTDPDGKVLLNKSISKDAPFDEKIATGSSVLVANYTVRIEGQCNLGNGAVTNAFYEGTFAAIPKAVFIEAMPVDQSEINSKKVEKRSFEKDEVFPMTYEIKHNGQASNGIERVTVNGTQVSGSFNKYGDFQIDLRAPKDAYSEYPFVLQSVKLRGNNKEAVIVDDTNIATQTIEVLKSKPTISDYSAVGTASVSEKSVTFKFKVNDPDSAFTGGKVELRVNGSEATAAPAATANYSEIGADGDVSVTVTGIETFTVYDVVIDADYKRGTGADTVSKAVLKETYELIGDYELKIEDIKTYSVDDPDIEKTSFNKGESARVVFTSTNVTTERESGPKYQPDKIKVEGEWYELISEGENKYSVEIPVGETVGKVAKEIQAVELNNTAIVDMVDTKINIEVKAEAPRVKDVLFEKEDNSTNIKLSFELVDENNALTVGQPVTLTVYDITDSENKTEALSATTITVGKVEKVITAQTGHVYQAIVKASYTLGEGEVYDNETILDLEMDMGARRYEIKDVNEVRLYKKNGGVLTLQSNVTVSELTASKDNYIAQVIPRRQPAFYANILSVEAEGRSIRLTLDYDNVASYHGGSRSTNLVVNYGIITGDVAEGDSFENLIRRMEADPTGTFVLNSDLDASGFKGSSESMLDSTITFTGTLDGNGHTISNLTKPIFAKLGAGFEVKNLIVDRATINQNGQYNGSVAKEAREGSFTNVFVTNANITSRANHVGALVGSINTVTITNVAVTGLIFTGGGHLRLGGIVGSTGNSKINNVYVTGTMSGSGDHAGGIAGSIENNTHINGAISAVEWKMGAGDNKGGIVGAIFQNNSTIKNTLSMIDAEGVQRTNGSLTMPAEYNNYALITSMSIRRNEKEIRDNEITDRFFKTMLSLDQSAWQIKGTSKSKLPILAGGDPRGAGVAGSTATDGVYIPDFDVVKRLGNYEKSKDILYSNLYKLMPFYESRDLLVDGAKIPVSHILNTKKIQGIIPYGEMVNGREVAIVGMSKQEPDKIKYIKVVFDDDTVQKYLLTYKSTGGNDNTIANYDIPELRIGYNYDKYLVDTDSSLYRETLAAVKAMDYQRDLNPLTPEDETRNYYENFDRWMRREGGPERFTLNLMANNPEYNAIYADTVNAEAAARSALNNDNQLKKLLYTYNYFDRFYDIEIGGVNMRDVVFFDGRLFSNALNSVNMTALMLGKSLTYDKNNNPQCERFTWNTAQFYNNTIMGYTGKSLGDFLEYYMVNIVSEEEYQVNAAAYTVETGQKPDKANAWMHSNFNGYIYEAPAEDFKDIEAAARGESRKLLEYRAWFHLKRMYSGNYILPFLTYDRDKQYNKDLYLVTYPTALMYGNMRLYWKDWETNPPSKEARDAKVKAFTDRAAKLYNTMGHILNDRTFEVLHNRTDVNHDSTRNAYSADMVGKTEEPVYKYINEVQNQWHRHNSAAAYANTVGGVFYCFYYTLDSYDIWTHENIHNQDGYMYLESTGKRHSEPENFTDGILTQGTDNALPVPNFSWDYDWEKNLAANQTTQRIMSTTDSEGNTITGRERYSTWYKNAYEAMRLLEYLEGKAFMSLTPKEQSALAYQTTYTNKEQNPTIITTTKSMISEAEFRNYNIKSFADLFDYRITLERSWVRGAWGNGVVVNSYWFIPTNDTNTITNESFKRNAHEMSAEGGYDGFVAWAGGAYRNDLDALRGITGIPNNTWRDHQINKYKKIEDKLFAENSNFDGDALIAWFKEGLELDAAKGDLSPYSNGYTNREILYTHFKRITNDFETSIFDAITPVKITTAGQLILAINSNPLGIYELEDDLDFEGVSGGDIAYISNTFFGELRGNGRTIRGLKKPLFNKVMYGTVQNLKINDANITGSGDYTGALMNYGFFDTVCNIEGINITLSGTGSDGGLIGFIERSRIEGIEVSGVNITSTKTQTGGIIGVATYSAIRDIHLNSPVGGTNLISGTDRAGGIIGYTNQCYIVEKCSSIAEIIASGNAIGGLIGQPDNSKIRDCYALGSVKGNRHTGGFAGWTENPDIANCYARVDVTANGASGGFVGRVNNSGKIANSVSFSNAANNGTYKFDGETPGNVIDAGYRNNYEYISGRGASTLSRTGIEWGGKLGVLTEENVSNGSFYSGTLEWSLDTWDVSTLSTGGLPKLKSERDKKGSTALVEIKKIRTATDFLKINEAPFAIFELENDIDLSDVSSQSTGASYITASFAGEIRGEGRTISNATKPIFGSINGAKISNLNVEGANITGGNTVFAGKIDNSEITKISINNAVIERNDKYLGILGHHPANTVLREISITNFRIDTTGKTLGGVAAQIEPGTTLEDIFVQGTIKSTTNGAEAGALAGWYNGDSANKVVTNIVFDTVNNSKNGGIIGYGDSNKQNALITNSLSLGTGKAYSITGSGNKTNFTNVYEIANDTEHTYTPQVQADDERVKSVTLDTLKTTEFYRDTLGLDESIWDISAETLEKYGSPVLQISKSIPEVQNEEDLDAQSLEDEEESVEDESEDESEDVIEEGITPVIEISSVEDFLKIKDNLAGEYILTKSISFEGVDIEGDAVIMGVFTGILRGLDGCTITGLSIPLFEEVGADAVIENINIVYIDRTISKIDEN